MRILNKASSLWHRIWEAPGWPWSATPAQKLQCRPPPHHRSRKRACSPKCHPRAPPFFGQSSDLRRSREARAPAKSREHEGQHKVVKKWLWTLQPISSDKPPKRRTPDTPEEGLHSFPGPSLEIGGAVDFAKAPLPQGGLEHAVPNPRAMLQVRGKAGLHQGEALSMLGAESVEDPHEVDDGGWEDGPEIHREVAHKSGGRVGLADLGFGRKSRTGSALDCRAWLRRIRRSRRHRFSLKSQFCEEDSGQLLLATPSLRTYGPCVRPHLFDPLWGPPRTDPPRARARTHVART